MYPPGDKPSFNSSLFVVNKSVSRRLLKVCALTILLLVSNILIVSGSTLDFGAPFFHRHQINPTTMIMSKIGPITTGIIHHLIGAAVGGNSVGTVGTNACLGAERTCKIGALYQIYSSGTNISQLYFRIVPAGSTGAIPRCTKSTFGYKMSFQVRSYIEFPRNAKWYMYFAKKAKHRRGNTKKKTK